MLFANREKAMKFTIDDAIFETETLPDLGFLKLYGKVFCVFDQSVSGNLCFGVNGPYGKLFIKYAGCRTVNATRRVSDAIETLKSSVEIYQLRHPAMINLLSYGPTADGYATVFEWFDGSPLRPLPMYPDEIRSSIQKLPLIQQLTLLDSVFDLHLALASRNLMAADFSDANVLIDPFSCTLKVCDLDRYLPFPSVNESGRMPGDADFLAPEEFVRDALITQRATVYKLGKIAFSFLGSGGSDDASCWTAPKKLFPLAARACSEAPEERFQSVEEFVTEWRNEIGKTYIR